MIPPISFLLLKVVFPAIQIFCVFIQILNVIVLWKKMLLVIDLDCIESVKLPFNSFVQSSVIITLKAFPWTSSHLNSCHHNRSWLSNSSPSIRPSMSPHPPVFLLLSLPGHPVQRCHMLVSLFYQVSLSIWNLGFVISPNKYSDTLLLQSVIYHMVLSIQEHCVYFSFSSVLSSISFSFIL